MSPDQAGSLDARLGATCTSLPIPHFCLACWLMQTQQHGAIKARPPALLLRLAASGSTENLERHMLPFNDAVLARACGSCFVHVDRAAVPCPSTYVAVLFLPDHAAVPCAFAVSQGPLEVIQFCEAAEIDCIVGLDGRQTPQQVR